jgi:hypothetical protein
MLGFTAISEAPISVGIVQTRVLGYLVSTSANTSINDIITSAKANIVPSSTLISISSEDLAYVALANLNIASTFSTTTASPVSYVAKANNTLNTQLLQNIAGVLDYIAKAVYTVPSATMATYIEDVVAKGQADITPISVVLNITASAPSYVALAHVVPASALLNIQYNELNPSLDNFDYAAIAESYSRERTLYLVAAEGYGSYTVYLQEPEDNSIYAIASGRDFTTVVVPYLDKTVVTLNRKSPENKTVYV